MNKMPDEQGNCVKKAFPEIYPRQNGEAEFLVLCLKLILLKAYSNIYKTNH